MAHGVGCGPAAVAKRVLERGGVASVSVSAYAGGTVVLPRGVSRLKQRASRPSDDEDRRPSRNDASKHCAARQFAKHFRRFPVAYGRYQKSGHALND